MNKFEETLILPLTILGKTVGEGFQPSLNPKQRKIIKGGLQALPYRGKIIQENRRGGFPTLP